MADDIIIKALRLLAADDPDGAREVNGIGFNGADSTFGRSLAQQTRLTGRQQEMAWKLLQKYRGQLSRNGLDLPDQMPGSPVSGMTAFKSGPCANCPHTINVGDTFSWGQVRGSRVHTDCPEESSSPAPAPLALVPAPVTRTPAPQPVQRDGLTARAVLGPDGLVADHFPGYEPREPQLRMADTVEEAINDGQHAVVEAGTGTGKSFGYMVPAILSRKRVIVSTADKSLQSQIWLKDVPTLQAILQEVRPFRAALLKGMGNYACLQRIHALKAKGQDLAFTTEEAADQWPDFITWLEETETGDVEEMTTGLHPSLKEDVTTDSEGCLAKKCPAYSRCFSMLAKARAKDADLTIVNHSLLLRDLELRHQTGGHVSLLPDADVIVLDEAHHLEDQATDAFGSEVSEGRWTRLARRLERFTVDHTAIRSQGTKAETSESGLLATFFMQQAQDVTISLDRLFNVIRDRMLSSRPRKERTRLGDETEAAGPAVRELVKLATLMHDAIPAWLEEEDREHWKNLTKSIGKLAETVEAVSRPGQDNVVRYAEMSGRGDSPRLTLLLKPIDVSDALRERLFTARLHRVQRGEEMVEEGPTVTVIATSATLSTSTGFTYWRDRVGLDDALELEVGSPFDYHQNSLLYLPQDGPALDPTAGRGGESIAYFDRLAGEVERLLLASDGRAFVLFTSNKALNETYNRLASRLRWTLLKQGDLPRPELVKRFKEDGKAVLFGVKSFWEGVDVQGEALSLVIVDKLPFNSPDDPIWEARCEAINTARGDRWAWFNELAIPVATIALKQAHGRLIRNKTDRGVVALLDGRLTTKGYGRKVIAALPPSKPTKSMEAVRTFLA